MLYRRSNGNVLNQYAILLGLIVLALVPVFILFGNQIVGTFSYYLDKYTDIGLHAERNVNIMGGSYLQKGDFGIETCSNGSCDINLGSLVLKGVPKNIEELIETSGVAGGTNELLQLLQQIADQKNAEGNIEEAKKITALIARGKEIMQMEQLFDAWYDKFGGTIEPYSNAHEQYINKVIQLQEQYIKSCSNSSVIAEGSYASYSGSNLELENCTFKTRRAESQYYQATDSAYASIIASKFPEFESSLGQIDTTSINGQTVKSSCIAGNLMYFLNPTAVIHLSTDGTADFMGYTTSFDTVSSSNFDDMLSGKIDYNAYKNPPGIPSDSSLLKEGTFINSPVGYYLDELKNLATTTKDPAVLNITKQLSEEIFKLAARVSEKTANIGNYIWDVENRSLYNYNQPTNEAVKTTNLDLSLICVANGGEYNSDGTCK